MSQGGRRSCEQDLLRLYGRCPDAPGFLNLFPGIWTGDHPPRKYYTPRLSKIKDVFVLKEPTNNAKVRERDFVCFAYFVGKGVLPLQETRLYCQNLRRIKLLKTCSSQDLNQPLCSTICT